MVLLAKGLPAVRRHEAPVAGVPQFFHLVNPFFRDRLAIRDTSVDQHEMAARFQDTRDLGDKSSSIAKMVRGDPARNEIKRGIGVREAFRFVQTRLDREATLCGQSVGAIQHGL